MVKKSTIGIIGAGRIGRMHAENIVNSKNIFVKSISDPLINNIQNWADEIGIQHTFTDYEEIINDEDIDAIFVCSPTSTHAEIIIAAANKKKHIFCEKPISYSIEETEDVLNAVKNSGVKFQVGFNRRFDRNFFNIRESVKGGMIGNPHVIKITSRDPEPPPAEYVKQSGGLFFDMSIHDFDMARYLSGSEVTEVYATGENLVEPYIKEIGDIDTAVITLKFANGALGVIDNSRKAVYGYDQRIEVFGEKGNLTCENERPTTVALSTSEGIHTDKLKHFFIERYKDSYIFEIHAFIDSIQNDTPLLCTGNDGLQAEIIAKAAKQSFLEGQPIKINIPSQIQN